eukprot:CAMPEP_0113680572 /NCGR_PEP_ID=MMETSP0038_2-20120614/11414_1 /TAXON_ID=2898 /ORGANISM="Cryptomonas paramecium" /LENGTH=337 /DNA_ID=CAMNT_0000599009 /DNA_START=175 /DNA_END=1188 /DNA_ORIENTATION=- /assembly_acc=CAM_ASM_000170
MSSPNPPPQPPTLSPNPPRSLMIVVAGAEELAEVVDARHGHAAAPAAADVASVAALVKALRGAERVSAFRRRWLGARGGAGGARRTCARAAAQSRHARRGQAVLPIRVVHAGEVVVRGNSARKRVGANIVGEEGPSEQSLLVLLREAKMHGGVPGDVLSSKASKEGDGGDDASGKTNLVNFEHGGVSGLLLRQPDVRRHHIHVDSGLNVSLLLVPSKRQRLHLPVRIHPKRPREGVEAVLKRLRTRDAVRLGRDEEGVSRVLDERPDALPDGEPCERVFVLLDGRNESVQLLDNVAHEEAVLHVVRNRWVVLDDGALVCIGVLIGNDVKSGHSVGGL